MDEESRKQIRLIVEDCDERTRLAIDQAVKGMLASQIVKGLLHSGSTIKLGLKLIEEQVRAFITSLVDKVAPVAKDIEAFAIMEEALSKLLPFLEAVRDDLVLKAARDNGDNKSSSDQREANELFRAMNSRLNRQLGLHRFTFTRIDPVRLSTPTFASVLKPNDLPPKNPGGKPRAQHWEEMWADIAAGLYLGDLNPKTQADLVRAMQKWFDDRNLEIGDTAITERARCLWKKIQAEC